jgi:hypothetical protein
VNHQTGPRWGRWLNIAAAVAVTGVLGVILVKVLVINRLQDVAAHAQAAAAVLSGTVTPRTYKHEPLVGNVWSATLVLDGTGRIVNLINAGTDGCVFDENIHAGDHLDVTGDPADLTPADVTDNGTNLGTIPVAQFAGGC